MIHAKVDIPGLCYHGNKWTLVLTSKSAHCRVDPDKQACERSCTKIPRKNKLTDPMSKDALALKFPVSIFRVAREHGPAPPSDQRQDVRVFLSALKVR